MADDAKVDNRERAPKDNVPQESVQDAEHFGRENELPNEDKREYWQQTGDDGDAQGPDAPTARVAPGTEADMEAPRRAQSNTYGSNQDGLTSSGATVDPDRTADPEP